MEGTKAGAQYLWTMFGLLARCISLKMQPLPIDGNRLKMTNCNDIFSSVAPKKTKHMLKSLNYSF